MALITEADAIRACNLTGTPTSDQLLTLDEMINALTPVIERITGPLDLRTITYSTVPGKMDILLPWPYVSITSVVLFNGTTSVTINPAQYDAVTDAGRGILWPAIGAQPWLVGQSLTITAVVGSVTVPDDVRAAAMLLIQSWWQTTQNAPHAAWGNPQANAPWVPGGSAIPSQVLMLLSSARGMPGFA